MSNIKKFFDDSANIKHFAKHYFTYLSKLLGELNLDKVSSFVNQLEEARIAGNTIFFIGNGGSAATASHMVNDLGVDIQKRAKAQPPLRVMSLTDNSAAMLAIANDSGYENLFVNQLRLYYRPGDKLVAISASGNSPNIVLAAEWVKKQGGAVLSLVGFDGGALKEISDVAIQVETVKGEYGPVEDIHLIMDHLISYWLEFQIQREQKTAGKYHATA